MRWSKDAGGEHGIADHLGVESSAIGSSKPAVFRIDGEGRTRDRRLRIHAAENQTSDEGLMDQPSSMKS